LGARIAVDGDVRSESISSVGAETYRYRLKLDIDEPSRSTLERVEALVARYPDPYIRL
jgi:hypothetical protein